MGRKTWNPVFSGRRIRARVTVYERDQRDYPHLLQLAHICTKVLLGRKPLEVHMEIMKLQALENDYEICYSDPCKGLILPGPMGKLYYSEPQEKWTYLQSLPLTPPDIFAPSQTRIDYMNIAESRYDKDTANSILIETVCDFIFTEAFLTVTKNSVYVDDVQAAIDG